VSVALKISAVLSVEPSSTNIHSIAVSFEAASEAASTEAINAGKNALALYAGVMMLSKM
jgi:hypothetical protein